MFQRDSYGVPDDLSLVKLSNQRVWDADPKRATDEALSAITKGGFDDDCINRRVGNYEGQVMAVLRGWAVRGAYGWTITEAGLEALRAAGRPVPRALPVHDTWHGKPRQFCVQETSYIGKPALKLAEDHIRYGSSGYGVPPGYWLLCHSDVRALRDYLTDWLTRNPVEPPATIPAASAALLSETGKKE